MTYQLEVDFAVVNKNWGKLEGYGLYFHIVNTTWKKYRKKNGILSIRLTNDKEMKYLNKKWRNKDVETNVLAFPNSSSKVLSNINNIGDIIMGYELVQKEANLKNIPIVNHVSHLMIHGLLHLLGFDHQNDLELRNMQKIEINILKLFNISNPYLY